MRVTSSAERSAIDRRWRRAGRDGGCRSSTRRISGIVGLLVLRCDEQDAVELVDLEQLHLDVLAAGRGQVLADVVRPDRQLAVAAVDEHRKLDARGAPELEQRLDRGA